MKTTLTGVHVLTGTPSLVAGRNFQRRTYSLAASFSPAFPPAPDTTRASATPPRSSTRTLRSTLPSIRWRRAIGGYVKLGLFRATGAITPASFTSTREPGLTATVVGGGGGAAATVVGGAWAAAAAAAVRASSARRCSSA